MPGKRRKNRRLIVLYYPTILLIYILDQLSKFYIEKFILQNSNIPVIKDIFHITLVHNTGAAFGMLREHPYLFVAIAIFAIIFMFYLLTGKLEALGAKEKLSLSFILGGTLGNLTDRLRFGYVIDFIDLRVWPVFNVADSFITIGALMLAWALFIESREHV